MEDRCLLKVLVLLSVAALRPSLPDPRVMPTKHILLPPTPQESRGCRTEAISAERHPIERLAVFIDLVIRTHFSG